MTAQLPSDLLAERTDDSLIGAERYTVGAMMLDGRSVPDVKAVVRPTDFYDWRYQAICETIFELHQKGRPVDVIATGTRMRVKDRFGGAGTGFDEVLLHELVGEVHTAANADYYASIVAGGAARRRLRAAGLSLIGAADDPARNIVHAIDEGRTLLEDAIPGELEHTPVGSLSGDFFDSLRTETTYTRTPWPDLDALITGWKPGRLCVIGARPATGKTLVGVQIAAVMAQYGRAVYFSAEMDKTEILGRMYASMGGVRVNGLERHALSPEEWQRLEETRPLVESLRLYVDDSATTWDQIEQTTWDLHRNGDLKMIVVDYLSLYGDGKRHESRRHELESMSRRAKQLAKRLGITVVVLQQLSREAERAGIEKPPTMAHLKDTGSLEQDADVVILLHQGMRKNPVTKQHEKDGELSLIVAKQRNGPTGTVDLVFEGAYARATHKFRR